MKAKLCQKNLRETPRAMDGTIKGMFTRMSNVVEDRFPNFFLAINIAIGNPTTNPRTVTIPPRRYERSRLCQYVPHTPEPETAADKVPLNTAWKAGKATKRDGTRMITRKTTKVTLFLEDAAFE